MREYKIRIYRVSIISCLIITVIDNNSNLTSLVSQILFFFSVTCDKANSCSSSSRHLVIDIFSQSQISLKSGEVGQIINTKSPLGFREFIFRRDDINRVNDL